MFTVLLVFFFIDFCRSSQWTSLSDFHNRLPGSCDSTKQFDCDGIGHECIDASKYHDGRIDCADGSDEFCFVGQRKCGRYCIDGQSNHQCPIGYDNDHDCTTMIPSPSFCPLLKSKLCRHVDAIPCKGYGECIMRSWLLDDKIDCIDGSDEDKAYAMPLSHHTSTSVSSDHSTTLSWSTTTTTDSEGSSPIYTTIYVSIDDSAGNLLTTTIDDDLSSTTALPTTIIDDDSWSTIEIAPVSAIYMTTLSVGSNTADSMCHSQALATAHNHRSSPWCSCARGQMIIGDECKDTNIGTITVHPITICGEQSQAYDDNDNSLIVVNELSNIFGKMSMCIQRDLTSSNSLVVQIDCSTNCSLQRLSTELRRNLSSIVTFGPLENINACDHIELNDCHVDAICTSIDTQYMCRCKLGFNDTSINSNRRGRDCQGVVNVASTCSLVFGICWYIIFLIGLVTLIAIALIVGYLLWRFWFRRRGHIDDEQILPLGDPDETRHDVISQHSLPAIIDTPILTAINPVVKPADIQSIVSSERISINSSERHSLKSMPAVEPLTSVEKPNLQDTMSVGSKRIDSPRSGGGTPTIWDTFRILGGQYARFSSAKSRKSSSKSIISTHSIAPISVEPMKRESPAPPISMIQGNMTNRSLSHIPLSIPRSDQPMQSGNVVESTNIPPIDIVDNPNLTEREQLTAQLPTESVPVAAITNEQLDRINHITEQQSTVTDIKPNLERLTESTVTGSQQPLPSMGRVRDWQRMKNNTIIFKVEQPKSSTTTDPDAMKMNVASITDGDKKSSSPLSTDRANISARSQQQQVQSPGDGRSARSSATVNIRSNKPTPKSVAISSQLPTRHAPVADQRPLPRAVTRLRNEFAPKLSIVDRQSSPNNRIQSRHRPVVSRAPVTTPRSILSPSNFIRSQSRDSFSSDASGGGSGIDRGVRRWDRYDTGTRVRTNLPTRSLENSPIIRRKPIIRRLSDDSENESVTSTTTRQRRQMTSDWTRPMISSDESIIFPAAITPTPRGTAIVGGKNRPFKESQWWA